MDRPSAAHRTLPFGTVIRVLNLDNGREIEVRVNDRGPFVRGRILDLSRAAAEDLGMIADGIADIRLWVLAWPATEQPTIRRAGAASSAEQRVVQAGAFRDRARAQQLARRVAQIDRRARVFSHQGWHRVQVHGLDGQAASRLVALLGSAGIDAVILPAD
jgi:rare lipoprotein A